MGLLTPEERLQVAKDALAAPPVEEESPIFRPRFWTSRKFVSSMALTVGCFAVAAWTGTLSATTAPLCAAPFLAWLGVEGAIDFRAVRK